MQSNASIKLSKSVILHRVNSIVNSFRSSRR